MNFGNAEFKTVNTSRPELRHSDSKVSVTASEDYYSLSEHASDPSDERTTVIRYNAPPAQLPSGINSQNPELQHSLHTREALSHVNESLVGTKSPEEQSNSRNPRPAATMTNWRGSRSDVSPPTPGADDTPYIQFAIDQLTRDEELLGRSRDGVYSEDVAPIIGEQLYLPDDTTWAPFRLSTANETAPKVVGFRLTSKQEPGKSGTALGTGTIRNAGLVPPYRPHDKPRVPPLNFVPEPIRLLPIAALAFLCLFMITGLIISCVWASKHNGLLQYDGTGTSRYFLFEFFPQLFAAVILLWLLVVQAAVQRILPLTLLTKTKTNPSEVLHNVPMFLTNYLIPNSSCFNHGEPLLGACFAIFWLCLFTVPLQSCVFQTRLYFYPDQAIWMWTVVQPVAWVLIVLYFLLVISLLFLTLRFARGTTGVKWDPVSLADLIAMLRVSNIATSLGTPGQWPTLPRNSQTSNRTGGASYDNGEAHAPTLMEKILSKPVSLRGLRDPFNHDLERQIPTPTRTRSLQRNLHSPFIRYRWTPWFLRDTWVVAWLVTAIVLMIAFVVVSFVHRAVQDGFQPLLPSTTTPLGFASANFLYSFLPAFLGMLLFLVWQPIDIYFRALEPFACLANPHGATADRSILLDYTACLPIQVSIKAAVSGHYKVAWISFISVISLLLPVLGGGVFTAQFIVEDQQVLEVASMPAYYALVVFVLVYAFSMLIIWPTRKRYLPHDIRTLGNILDFVHQSPLFEHGMFTESKSKNDLVTRLAASGEKSGSRFALGVFRGKNGKEWLGIDRVHSVGRNTTPTTTK